MLKHLAYLDHATTRWFFVCSARGLECVTVKPLQGAQAAEKSPDVVQQHARALVAQLEGRSKKYALPLNVSGSPFQMRVWEEIAKIPHGETISYTELATRAGKPKAVRAAASACGSNPVPLAIPCHRVLRSDGTLGGFAFGLPLKQRMLEFEQSCVMQAQQHAA